MVFCRGKPLLAIFIRHSNCETALNKKRCPERGTALTFNYQNYCSEAGVQAL